MKRIARLFLILVSLIFVFDAPIAEAAPRKRRGSATQSGRKSGRSGKSSGRSSHRSGRRSEAPRKVSAPADPRVALREKFARGVADSLFFKCLAIGQAQGKNDVEKNYFSRRCLALGVIKLENSVIELMKKQGKPNEDIAEHIDALYLITVAYQLNSLQGLEAYDTLNLYYVIYTNKKLQQELLFPIK